MDDKQSKIEAIWSGTEVEIAQAYERESREAMREEYVRAVVRALESPEHGGYVARDISEIVGPADKVERQYLKRAFKRLVKRGELAKVAPVEGGLLYRLV